MHLKEHPSRKQTTLRSLVVLSALLVSSCSSLLCVRVAHAAETASAEQLEFFELEVRPLLARRCLECHGAEKQEGELRLDSLTSMISGGESGDASVVPGHPAESPFMEAIRYESYEMPPDQQLPDNEIAVFDKWIKIGSPWPGDHQTKIPAKGQ